MRAYKTELKPTQEQIQLMNQTFGNCRWVYNSYIAYNQKQYEKDKTFVSGYEYSKYINHSPDTPDWLKLTSSKATKQAIMYAERAFKNFFKKQAKFPRFKKKGKSKDSFYLIGSFHVERHRIKLPNLGWVRLKEYGYIPTNDIPKSVTVFRVANKYYVSALYDISVGTTYKPRGEPLGIDLGIKDLAICSDGTVYKNINKSTKVKKLEKQLKRQQRALSRKYEYKKKRKGEATNQNILKQQLKVQRLYNRLTNVRTDYQNKVINSIIKQKPSYITIEDLNVTGMMKNKHLSKAVQQQRFFDFKTHLLQKANDNNIEVRQVNRWYPSSKICSCCGFKKVDLSLSDRVYECSNCGSVIDRDLNASINLLQAKDYIVLT